MKIKNHIPNTITSFNLLSGCFAVTLAFSGDFKPALLCIIAAAIFDFFDGFAARLLKAYSPMGKELDSLADMVSFGLAPACIVFNKLLALLGIEFISLFTLDFAIAAKYMLALLCAFLIAVFSALRLGKFNIDTRQSENFIGLATPSCALLVGSFVYATEVYPALNLIMASHIWILPVASVILSLLLTCEIPMFSFKFKSLKWADNANRFLFLGIIAVLGILAAITGLNWSLWICSIFVIYILINITVYLIHSASRTKRA